MREILLAAAGNITPLPAGQVPWEYDDLHSITYQNLERVSIKEREFYFLLTAEKITILINNCFFPFSCNDEIIPHLLLLTYPAELFDNHSQIT
jgi:hypothetical protein